MRLIAKSGTLLLIAAVTARGDFENLYNYHRKS